MSCGCNPKTGRDFDPCCEGVSDADQRRFNAKDQRCPECDAEVYDSATICQDCGYAFVAPTKSKTWIAVTGAVLLVGFALSYVFIFR